MKPRRTASGVATITVITKPRPCSGDCLFCPNDLRMPKAICTPSRHAPVRSKIALTRICR